MQREDGQAGPRAGKHAAPARWEAAGARVMARALRAICAAWLLVWAGASVHAQPARLSETGLFASGAPIAEPRSPAPSAPSASSTSATGPTSSAAIPLGARLRLAPELIPFTPQFPLWSDGADKRRWLRLPRGAAIDARDVDAWRFPRGTRLWKEFSHGGRPVETRYIEHGLDGRWRYATYAWRADGSDADLVPAQGVPAWPAAQAPGGLYALPSVADCQACHESSAVPVLGFSAVQLPARRVGSAEGTDLQRLVGGRRLRRLDPALLSPRRAPAANDDERAALGYLHGNCGHCHNRSGHQVPLRLTLAQRAGDPVAGRAEVLGSALGAKARFRAPGADDGVHDRVVAPGDPAQSLLVQRMASRDPRLQMPPLGTSIPDEAGLALVRRWITHAPRP